MNRYTVVWDEAVENHFLDAWLKSDAASRAVLTEVANLIDRTLSVDAEVRGELQADGITRGVVIQVSSAKVTVFFETRTVDRLVRIVRLIFRRGG